MGCKMVFLYMLVLRSSLAASYNDGLQKRDQQTSPMFIQSNENSVWPRDQERFESRPNVYGPQISNYDNITPTPTPRSGYYYSQMTNGANLQQFQQASPTQQTPPPYIANNGPTARWWNSLKDDKPQQAQIYGHPAYDLNSIKTYAYPGNYAPKYSYYQSPGAPVLNYGGNHKNYEQERQLQNKYRPGPGPVEYIPWPVSDDQTLQTVSTDNNNLPYLVIDPPKEIPKDDPSKGKLVRVNAKSSTTASAITKEQDKIALSQLPVNTEPTKAKHYIIVYMNGTYERIDNLNDIVVDEFNVAHIKSKKPPNNVLAIIEVEKETEKPPPLEYPYDTGISKIPQNTDLDKNDNDYFGMVQSYDYSFPQYTTNDLIYNADYFKPEYLIPIESTTDNIIDITTHPSSNAFITEDNLETKRTINTTELHERVQNVDNNNTNYWKYNQPDYVVTNTENYNNSTNSIIKNGVDGLTNSASNILADSSEYIHTNENNNNIIYTTQPKKNENRFSSATNEYQLNIEQETFQINTDTRKGYQYEDQEIPEPEPTSDDKDNEVNTTEKSTTTSATSVTPEMITDQVYDNESEKTSLPITPETIQLRDDLRIDASELKTVVDKPMVWFRTDDDFWYKVTQGEQAFDALSIYNVHCKPQLIERVTNIHHFPNGTETVEYIETIWDSADAANPKEIRSKREIRDSQ